MVCFIIRETKNIKVMHHYLTLLCLSIITLCECYCSQLRLLSVAMETTGALVGFSDIHIHVSD